MTLPLLTSLIALPIAGALVLLLVDTRDNRNERLVRNLALGASVAVFLATLVLWWRFDPTSADFQFVERHAWIPAFGIQYYIGIDGISLLLIVLTGFLTPIALLSSWESIHTKAKEFSIFILLLEAAMIGVFVSLDLFLFYVFWDAMLIPMYFLIGIWGYDRRVYAAVKFILYTMAGSVLMLVAILGLAYLHHAATGSYSFDLLQLYGLHLPQQTQFWFFLAFTLAFAIKVPLFPFHTWLPDLKKLVAYSSVSHLGFVVLGICALNMQGVQGAVYQMLNHGVSTGALFLIVGMLSDRRHTRLIAEFGGLKKVMPKLVAMFLLVTLASIGLPGLNGFVGEFLVLLGTFRADPRMAAFAATGVILSAVYMLWMFQRVNYGQVTNEKNAKLPDLSPREWWAIAPLAVMVVVMGVLPGIFLRPMAPSIDRTLQRISQGMSFTVENHRTAGAAAPAQAADPVPQPAIYVPIHHSCATGAGSAAAAPASFTGAGTMSRDALRASSER